jgi:MPBQ/MSBQ methyltransferase
MMETMNALPGLLPAEVELLRQHLRARYAGVFSEESIEAHLQDYVGFPFAEQIAPLVEGHLPPNGRVADLGCGFGSFVLCLLGRGHQAVGVELDDFEVGLAQRRAERLFPGLVPQEVFFGGDAARLPLPEGSFDAVTCWNLLEHVEDDGQLIRQAHRLLKPGGSLFVICPNYFAFRQEAHYLVPWRPLLSRRAAVARLRRAGKDPAYFETGIFQRSNWGVLWTLLGRGFALHDLLSDARLDPLPENLPGLSARLRQALTFYNPLKESILLRAVKRST